VTVLVYRDGVIAADRRVNFDEDMPMGAMSKLSIFSTKDYKCVVGMAGNADSDDNCVAMAKEIVETGARPSYPGDLTLLIVAVPKDSRKKRMLIDFTSVSKNNSSLLVYRGAKIPEYFARGAGASVALGCMFAHKDSGAIKAVRAAIKHSSGCGDGINYVDTKLPLDKWRVRSKRK